MAGKSRKSSESKQEKERDKKQSDSSGSTSKGFVGFFSRKKGSAESKLAGRKQLSNKTGSKPSLLSITISEPSSSGKKSSKSEKKSSIFSFSRKKKDKNKDDKSKNTRSNSIFSRKGSKAKKKASLPQILKPEDQTNKRALRQLSSKDFRAPSLDFYEDTSRNTSPADQTNKHALRQLSSKAFRAPSLDFDEDTSRNTSPEEDEYSHVIQEDHSSMTSDDFSSGLDEYKEAFADPKFVHSGTISTRGISQTGFTSLEDAMQDITAIDGYTYVGKGSVQDTTEKDFTVKTTESSGSVVTDEYFENIEGSSSGQEGYIGSAKALKRGKKKSPNTTKKSKRGSLFGRLLRRKKYQKRDETASDRYKYEKAASADDLSPKVDANNLVPKSKPVPGKTKIIRQRRLMGESELITKDEKQKRNQGLGKNKVYKRVGSATLEGSVTKPKGLKKVSSACQYEKRSVSTSSSDEYQPMPAFKISTGSLQNVRKSSRRSRANILSLKQLKSADIITVRELPSPQPAKQPRSILKGSIDSQHTMEERSKNGRRLPKKVSYEDVPDYNESQKATSSSKADQRTPTGHPTATRDGLFKMDSKVRRGSINKQHRGFKSTKSSTYITQKTKPDVSGELESDSDKDRNRHPKMDSRKTSYTSLWNTSADVEDLPLDDDLMQVSKSRRQSTVTEPKSSGNRENKRSRSKQYDISGYKARQFYQRRGSITNSVPDHTEFQKVAKSSIADRRSLTGYPTATSVKRDEIDREIGHGSISKQLRGSITKKSDLPDYTEFQKATSSSMADRRTSTGYPTDPSVKRDNLPEIERRVRSGSVSKQRRGSMTDVQDYEFKKVASSSMAGQRSYPTNISVKRNGHFEIDSKVRRGSVSEQRRGSMTNKSDVQDHTEFQKVASSSIMADRCSSSSAISAKKDSPSDIENKVRRGSASEQRRGSISNYAEFQKAKSSNIAHQRSITSHATAKSVKRDSHSEITSKVRRDSVSKQRRGSMTNKSDHTEFQKAASSSMADRRNSTSAIFVKKDSHSAIENKVRRGSASKQRRGSIPDYTEYQEATSSRIADRRSLASHPTAKSVKRDSRSEITSKVRSDSVPKQWRGSIPDYTEFQEAISSSMADQHSLTSHPTAKSVKRDSRSEITSKVRSDSVSKQRRRSIPDYTEFQEATSSSMADRRSLTSHPTAKSVKRDSRSEITSKVRSDSVSKQRRRSIPDYTEFQEATSSSMADRRSLISHPTAKSVKRDSHSEITSKVRRDSVSKQRRGSIPDYTEFQKSTRSNMADQRSLTGHPTAKRVKGDSHSEITSKVRSDRVSKQRRGSIPDYTELQKSTRSSMADRRSLTGHPTAKRVKGDSRSEITSKVRRDSVSKQRRGSIPDYTELQKSTSSSMADRRSLTGHPTAKGVKSDSHSEVRHDSVSKQRRGSIPDYTELQKSTRSSMADRRSLTGHPTAKSVKSDSHSEVRHDSVSKKRRGSIPDYTELQKSTRSSMADRRSLTGHSTDTSDKSDSTSEVSFITNKSDVPDYTKFQKATSLSMADRRSLTGHSTATSDKSDSTSEVSFITNKSDVPDYTKLQKATSLSMADRRSSATHPKDTSVKRYDPSEIGSEVRRGSVSKPHRGSESIKTSHSDSGSIKLDVSTGLESDSEDSIANDGRVLKRGSYDDVPDYTEFKKAASSSMTGRHSSTSYPTATSVKRDSPSEIDSKVRRGSASQRRGSNSTKTSHSGSGTTHKTKLDVSANLESDFDENLEESMANVGRVPKRKKYDGATHKTIPAELGSDFDEDIEESIANVGRVPKRGSYDDTKFHKAARSSMAVRHSSTGYPMAPSVKRDGPSGIDSKVRSGSVSKQRRGSKSTRSSHLGSGSARKAIYAELGSDFDEDLEESIATVGQVPKRSIPDSTMASSSIAGRHSSASYPTATSVKRDGPSEIDSKVRRGSISKQSRGSRSTKISSGRTRKTKLDASAELGSDFDQDLANVNRVPKRGSYGDDPDYTELQKTSSSSIAGRHSSTGSIAATTVKRDTVIRGSVSKQHRVSKSTKTSHSGSGTTHKTKLYVSADLRSDSDDALAYNNASQMPKRISHSETASLSMADLRSSTAVKRDFDSKVRRGSISKGSVSKTSTTQKTKLDAFAELGSDSNEESIAYVAKRDSHSDVPDYTEFQKVATSMADQHSSTSYLAATSAKRDSSSVIESDSEIIHGSVSKQRRGSIHTKTSHLDSGTTQKTEPDASAELRSDSDKDLEESIANVGRVPKRDSYDDDVPKATSSSKADRRSSAGYAAATSDKRNNQESTVRRGSISKQHRGYITNKSDVSDHTELTSSSTTDRRSYTSHPTATSVKREDLSKTDSKVRRGSVSKQHTSKVRRGSVSKQRRGSITNKSSKTSHLGPGTTQKTRKDLTAELGSYIDEDLNRHTKASSTSGAYSSLWDTSADFEDLLVDDDLMQDPKSRQKNNSTGPKKSESGHDKGSQGSRSMQYGMSDYKAKRFAQHRDKEVQKQSDDLSNESRSQSNFPMRFSKSLIFARLADEEKKKRSSHGSSSMHLKGKKKGKDYSSLKSFSYGTKGKTGTNKLNAQKREDMAHRRSRTVNKMPTVKETKGALRRRSSVSSFQHTGNIQELPSGEKKMGRSGQPSSVASKTWLSSNTASQHVPIKDFESNDRSESGLSLYSEIEDALELCSVTSASTRSRQDIYMKSTGHSSAYTQKHLSSTMMSSGQEQSGTTRREKSKTKETRRSSLSGLSPTLTMSSRPRDKSRKYSISGSNVPRRQRDSSDSPPFSRGSISHPLTSTRLSGKSKSSHARIANTKSSSELISSRFSRTKKLRRHRSSSESPVHREDSSHRLTSPKLSTMGGISKSDSSSDHELTSHTKRLRRHRSSSVHGKDSSNRLTSPKLSTMFESTGSHPKFDSSCSHKMTSPKLCSASPTLFTSSDQSISAVLFGKKDDITEGGSLTRTDRSRSTRLKSKSRSLSRGSSPIKPSTFTSARSESNPMESNPMESSSRRLRDRGHKITSLSRDRTYRSASNESISGMTWRHRGSIHEYTIPLRDQRSAGESSFKRHKDHSHRLTRDKTITRGSASSESDPIITRYRRHRGSSHGLTSPSRNRTSTYRSVSNPMVTSFKSHMDHSRHRLTRDKTITHRSASSESGPLMTTSKKHRDSSHGLTSPSRDKTITYESERRHRDSSHGLTSLFKDKTYESTKSHRDSSHGLTSPSRDKPITKLKHESSSSTIDLAKGSSRQSSRTKGVSSERFRKKRLRSKSSSLSRGSSPILPSSSRGKTMAYSRDSSPVLPSSSRGRTMAYSRGSSPVLPSSSRGKTTAYSRGSSPVLPSSSRGRTMAHSRGSSPVLPSSSRGKTTAYSRGSSPVLPSSSRGRTMAHSRGSSPVLPSSSRGRTMAYKSASSESIQVMTSSRRFTSTEFLDQDLRRWSSSARALKNGLSKHLTSPSESNAFRAAVSTSIPKEFSGSSLAQPARSAKEIESSPRSRSFYSKESGRRTTGSNMDHPSYRQRGRSSKNTNSKNTTSNVASSRLSSPRLSSNFESRDFEAMSHSLKRGISHDDPRQRSLSGRRSTESRDLEAMSHSLKRGISQDDPRRRSLSRRSTESCDLEAMSHSLKNDGTRRRSLSGKRSTDTKLDYPKYRQSSRDTSPNDTRINLASSRLSSPRLSSNFEYRDLEALSHTPRRGTSHGDPRRQSLDDGGRSYGRESGHKQQSYGEVSHSRRQESSSSKQHSVSDKNRSLRRGSGQGDVDDKSQYSSEKKSSGKSCTFKEGTNFSGSSRRSTLNKQSYNSTIDTNAATSGHSVKDKSSLRRELGLEDPRSYTKATGSHDLSGHTRDASLDDISSLRQDTELNDPRGYTCNLRGPTPDVSFDDLNSLRPDHSSGYTKVTERQRQGISDLKDKFLDPRHLLKRTPSSKRDYSARLDISSNLTRDASFDDLKDESSLRQEIGLHDSRGDTNSSKFRRAIRDESLDDLKGKIHKARLGSKGRRFSSFEEWSHRDRNEPRRQETSLSDLIEISPKKDVGIHELKEAVFGSEQQRQCISDLKDIIFGPSHHSESTPNPRREYTARLDRLHLLRDLFNQRRESHHSGRSKSNVVPATSSELNFLKDGLTFERDSCINLSKRARSSSPFPSPKPCVSSKYREAWGKSLGYNDQSSSFDSSYSHRGVDGQISRKKEDGRINHRSEDGQISYRREDARLKRYNLPEDTFVPQSPLGYRAQHGFPMRAIDMTVSEAASSKLHERPSSILARDLTCSVCNQYFKDPRILPYCCHYYCKECIHRLILESGGNKPFLCPECHTETTLPQGGISSLQPVSFINRIKNVHKKMKLAEGKAETACEICSEFRAMAYCRQCAQFICIECAHQHRRMRKTFAGHIVLTLNQLKKTEVSLVDSVFEMCEVHEQPMNIFCFDCNCCICCDCTVKSHLTHSFEFIKVAASKMRNHLIQQLGSIKDTQVASEQALENTKKAITEVEAQKQSVTTHIDNALHELHETVDDRKHELVTEAGVQVQTKIESLSQRKKRLFTKCNLLQSVINYTEQCVQHLDDCKLLFSYNDIKNRVNMDTSATLEPDDDMDIAVEVACIEDFKHLCHSNINLISQSTTCQHTQSTNCQQPPACQHTQPVVETYNAPVSTPSQVTNYTITQAATAKVQSAAAGIHSAVINKNTIFHVSTEGHAKVRASLKSLVTGTIYKCNVSRNNGGCYNIQYTPSTRGRHELMVTVNRVAITGSPFPVFVSIPPTQMGQPVRVITGLNNPCSVDVFAGGEMIVAELNDFVIMTRQGKKLKLLRGSKLDMYHPCGVAVDSVSRCIFLAGKASDSTDGKIVKLSPDYRLMCEVKNKGRFWGFTLVRNEIMACDINNNCIMVYSAQNLTYVRRMGSHGSRPGQFCSVRDISSDHQGNLYVSSDSRIQVFNNFGQFLRSFECNKVGLMSPRGVCVSREYVYITDWDNHFVSVFTTQGDFVTSFGGRGSQEGKFDSPCGMCVDEDGILYVCDYLRRRIQAM